MEIQVVQFLTIGPCINGATNVGIRFQNTFLNELLAIELYYYATFLGHWGISLFKSGIMAWGYKWGHDHE